VTLTPKQRLARLVKAHKNFEAAYVEVLRELPDDAPERETMHAAHAVVRKLRREAEAAQNAPESPQTR